MPEYSYIALACKKLKVDPSTILAFHEYDDHLAIITSEGKKFVFPFKELGKFHASINQTLEKPSNEPTELAKRTTRPKSINK